MCSADFKNGPAKVVDPECKRSTGEVLERFGLLTVREDFLDMLMHHFRRERFADEPRPLWHVPRPRLDVAGGNHDGDVRPARGGFPR